MKICKEGREMRWRHSDEPIQPGIRHSEKKLKGDWRSSYRGSAHLTEPAGTFKWVTLGT